MTSRSLQLWQQHRKRVYQQTDRIFIVLMILQWVAGIAVALWISPRAWAGRSSSVHVHVWSAVFLGGAVTAMPVVLALLSPGRAATRYVIAGGQMLMSALLIHLSGGRIETHFHIFGSLAVLAFYRDWKVLIPATLVVATDHLVRGVYFPASAFGTLAASSWRWAEHTAWVLFEDTFLVISCLRGDREMGDIAERQARLEEVNEGIEREVRDRTRELRENQSRLQAVLETAREGIVTTDHRGALVFVNPAAEQMFGWSTAEATGRPFSTLISSRFKEANAGLMLNLFAALSASGSRETAAMEGIRRDATPFPIEISVAAWHSAGKRFFTAILRDVTERKRAEQEVLEAKEEAEAANRAKSEFLANMSHEIRTPLNGIIGMTELALETDLTAAQRDYLSTVKDSADALTTVINDILDFSKIEAGKLSLDLIEFNLRDHLSQTTRALAVRAHQKGLEITCSIPPELPEYVVGDPTRLRQILTNLVGNAVKFTAEGEVVLRVEREEMEEATALHFSVSDTGIGIPREKQKTIFEPFTQADTSTTRQYGGTGLGLSISTRLVELMGGRIWVESEAGRGSTFHFVVPVAVGAGAGAHPPLADPEELENLKVLVVDDNATNRRLLESLLSHWRMRPVTAADGAAALRALLRAKAESAPFALLIVDCHMPVTDGFTLVEQIQRMPELRGPAIVMLTSGGSRGDALRCRELGIGAYLNKPVIQPDLLEAILKVMAPKGPAARAEPLVTKHTLREGRAPLRILVAEDNEVNQKLIVRMLENRGHAVTTANDGLAALKSLEDGEFDVVLMDVQMPVMDGLQATAAIREREKSRHARVPIIALTAHAMSGDRERFLSHGMDSYVAKPVHPEELFAAIEQVLAPAGR